MLRRISCLALIATVSGCQDGALAEEGGGSTAGTTSESGAADSATTSDPTVDATVDPDDGSSDDDAGPGPGGGQSCTDLVSQITETGIGEHLAAFVEHATANAGNRAAGSPGYDASATYVEQTLAAAGYDVQIQPFEFERFSVNAAPVLEQTAPQPVAFPASDFAVADYSGAGDVTAPLTPVDLQLGPGNAATSGCEPGDFGTFPAGNIALIQRGNCTFAAKVQNAQAAGAAGVVLFNQGSDGSNQGLFGGTLGAGNGIDIPVVFATYGTGETLAGTNGAVVHLVVDATIELVQTHNVIVDTPYGDPNDLIMYGAHLDSVPAGPGINDNGTGSAALLEVAKAVADCSLRRRVRFAWWGAEEVGLLGSNHYVEQLTPEERATHRFYLNFDMIGSPNYARLIYDGDGSAFDSPGPGNSDELEALFIDYFASLGLPTGAAEFNLRSDYAAFVMAGIPSGGVFTGAEGTKTQQQAELYGGQAGEPFDACYHQGCDGFENVDLELAAQIGEAIAYSVEVYALDE